MSSSNSDTSSNSTGSADFFDSFFKARAGLTSPGAPFELIDSADAQGHLLKAFKNAFPHLPALLNAGRAHGAKEFIVQDGERWSFERFFASADALAGHLQHTLGVQAVPVPLNSYGLHDELVAALKLTSPRARLADTPRLQRIDTSLAGLVQAVVEVPDVPADQAAWDSAVDRVGLSVPVDHHACADMTAAGGPQAGACEPGPEDPALILFTSGATSQAKGVVSSHRAVCQALFNIDFIGALSAMTSPQAIAGFMQRGFAPTTLTAVPLFHVSGLHAQLLTSLRHGRRLVFMRRWDPARALELIRDEHITQFNGAPSMVLQLIEQPGFDRNGAARSLGGLGFGGAGLPQRLIDQVGRHMAGTMTGIGFGLTETNGVGSAASGLLFEHAPRAAGVLSPLIECRIADEAGHALAPGQPGEIWLRGVSLMQGYWGQPEATAQVMGEGWFRTGDVGVLDAHGLLQVVDRIKDVINRNGEKIAAAEVESCLLLHPQVQEVAVYGVPDDSTGEAIVAEVVARPGATLSAEALRAHAAAHLAAYKVPLVLRVRREPLPRNPAGKLLKAPLRNAFSRRVG